MVRGMCRHVELFLSSLLAISVFAPRLAADFSDAAPDAGAWHQAEIRLVTDIGASVLHASAAAAIGGYIAPNSQANDEWASALAQAGADGTGTTVSLVIALPTSVNAGTLIASWQAAYRKDGARESFALDDPAWQTMAEPPRQATPRLLPFPPETRVSALRLTARTPDRGSLDMPLIRLLSERRFNATPVAVINAESEYTLRPSMGPPHVYAARSLTHENGEWRNAGPESPESDFIARAAVSDVHPSWLVLSWDAPRQIEGVMVRGNLSSIVFYEYIGPAGLNPSIAPDAQWRRLRAREDYLRHSGWAGSTSERWFSFPAVETLGLKLLIERTDGSPVARVEALSAIARLTTDEPPVPVVPPVTGLPIPYTLETEGLVTMAITDAQGRIIRNLIARRNRAAGENNEYWDLKDAQGSIVEPGVYGFKAITHPPLVLRYQMTPYPNVVNFAPENTPWETGHSGTGGWLADHTPEEAVTTAGDRVYIGAGTAEDGVAMIETDLDGRKLWGRHNFIAWTGPQRMAANDDAVFVHAWSPHVFADGADHVWRVDRATHQTRDLLVRRREAERARGVTGIAVYGDSLLLSVRGSLRWLVSAVTEDNVDIDNSLPRYARRDRELYSPDPRRDFMRLFRITGTPPGQHVGLTVLDTERGPESRQHILLALRRPVEMGTLVFPVPALDGLALRFSTLKPDVQGAPDVRNEAQWETVPMEPGIHGWAALPLPPATRTRALRVTFTRGEDDIFAEALESVIENAAPKAWSASIEGIKILKRRFRSLLPEAEILVNSGHVTESGEWDAARETPLTPENPAIYALTWQDAQTMRGLAIKEIDAKRVEIDIFTGAAGAPISIEDDTAWSRVADYTPPRRYFYSPDDNHNSGARYMDGYVDFGSNVVTRAVRLRMVEQWTTRADGRDGLYGVRRDRGGLDLSPSRCFVYGVAPLQYLGGGATEDPLVTQRLEVYNIESGQLERELPLADALDLATGPDGQVYALTSTSVLKLELESGEHRTVVDGLQRPRALAVGRDGRFYVFEAAPELAVVRLYDRDGTLLRHLGTPGGFQVGAWDATRFGNVTDMAIDRRGQLWAVEYQNYPKRTTVWNAEGEFLREHFGRTEYGGSGVVDPVDPSLLYVGPLEFEMNPDTGLTRLRNLTWLGSTQAGEQPIYIDGRKYLVTRDRFFYQAAGIVYRYEDGRLHLAAAMGLADRFAPLTGSQFRPALAGRPLNDYQFVWSDLNGNGAVDTEEVKFSERRISHITNFDKQLGITGDGLAFEVERFLPNGVPIYSVRELPFRGNNVYRLLNGNYFIMGEARGRDAEGNELWHYPTEGTGVHAYYYAAPLSPEQVVAEFSIVGHGVAPGGDLGEFLITSSNAGAWHLWTADGLLAGYIFLDQRDPRARRWNMPEQRRGMVVENISALQEHFWGSVTQTEDGRTLGVYRSSNVFEIEGMDRFRRLSGAVNVTVTDIAAALDNARREAAVIAYSKPRLVVCHSPDNPIRVDGDDKDWAALEGVSLDVPEPFSATLKIANDARFLYVLYDVSGMGPFKNSGEDARQLFKTGAAVDLMLGVNPNAPADRGGPVAGDQRLLFAMLEGRPVAMLYEAVVPGLAGHTPERFATMVFAAEFDRIRRIDGAVIAAREREGGYRLEAAVPLRDLGLPPPPGSIVKFDWGVLRADARGQSVLGRHYWSNQATRILSDVAAEAALEPRLWGHMRFPVPGEQRKGVPPLPGIDIDPSTGSPDHDRLFDEFMEELR